jgi:hypothetical protein
MKFIIRVNSIEPNIELIGKKINLQLQKEFLFMQFVPENKTSYQVSDIDRFKKKLSFSKNINNQNHFYLLTHGHNMSNVIQNSLLKTLEESKYPIGIITSNHNSLLPTLYSRCQVILIDEELYTNEYFELDYDSMLKMERKELIIYLEKYIKNLDMQNFLQIDNLDKALKMIKANCKIEPVIIELQRNLQRINV